MEDETCGRERVPAELEVFEVVKAAERLIERARAAQVAVRLRRARVRARAQRQVAQAGWCAAENLGERRTRLEVHELEATQARRELGSLVTDRHRSRLRPTADGEMWSGDVAVAIEGQ